MGSQKKSDLHGNKLAIVMSSPNPLETAGTTKMSPAPKNTGGKTVDKKGGRRKKKKEKSPRQWFTEAKSQLQLWKNQKGQKEKKP